MAKSINTKVDLTVDGTWFRGIASYGKIMIGDKAFEFYNERNVEDVPADHMRKALSIWQQIKQRFTRTKK